MDGSRFDALARAWSTTRPRRALLKGLAGGIGAGLLAAGGVKPAAAACTQYGRACGSGNECCSENCVEGKCACRDDKTRCGTRCVDLRYNESHCGACDRPCPEGQACRNGECGCAQYGAACKGDDTCCSKNCVDGACACAAGKTRCGTRCVDLRDNENHCGACGRTCGPDVRCRDGTCACPPDWVVCDGIGCVEPEVCPDLQRFETATCRCECLPRMIVCNGSCCLPDQEVCHDGVCIDPCVLDGSCF